MSSNSKELTYAEVAEHNSRKDLYLVIHDKVYDTSGFVDEHPGGEEVLLDVAGQDATEAFEDVGHSDEARQVLEELLVGTIKRKPGDPKPHSLSPKPHGGNAPADAAGLGIGLYVMLIGGALAFFGYKYLQTQSEAKA